jgi:radical SAM protein with 4Fe4S-binding SPASM domain
MRRRGNPMLDIDSRLIRTEAQEDCGFLTKQKDPYLILSETLGDTFKEYRRLWDAASNFELETEFPLQLDFELNYSCNLRCPMCTWSVETTAGLGKKSYFPMETFEEIVRYGVSKGMKALDMSFVNEPLLRPDLPEFVAYAKATGVVDVGFNTNATLLTEDMGRRLIKAGVTRIQFSIDAFSVDTYNKVRTGGDYNRVVGNVLKFLDIKQVMRSNLPLTAVSFVKQRDNIHEVEAFVEFWEPRVDYLLIREYLNPVLPSNVHFDEKSQMFSDSRHFTGEFRCTKPWQRMIVRYDGTLLPCCTFQGAYLPMGNAFEAPIDQVWKSAKMRDLRDMHKKGEFHRNPICKACALSSTVSKWEK